MISSIFRRRRRSRSRRGSRRGRSTAVLPVWGARPQEVKVPTALAG